MIEDVALVVASAVEGSQHVDRGLSVYRKLVIEFSQVLKASFVYDLRSNNLRIADLQRVLGGFGVISLRSQSELARSLVILCIPIILIADGQRIVLAQGIVETGREISAMPEKR
jgi:hypothetical protein